MNELKKKVEFQEKIDQLYNDLNDIKQLTPQKLEKIIQTLDFIPDKD